MGQKCNPTGLRIGVIKNWDSRWYAKKGEFGDTLVEDYKLRKYLLETLSGAGVPKVEIERDAKRVRINIHCAKPGMVIGKQGTEIEKLRALCAKKLGKELNEVYINIVEINLGCSECGRSAGAACIFPSCSKGRYPQHHAFGRSRYQDPGQRPCRRRRDRAYRDIQRGYDPAADHPCRH